ncbi:MAG: hypothetical protein K5622_04390 [Endomicrobiaceae bacterium]|nr:hypothetical protein [Endomicrobiaceae bacterium]
MNDFFNRNNINTAYDVMRYAEVKEKEERAKELERQKKELYDNKVLEVAEETRDIEKQNLTISKKIFLIAKITLGATIIGIIISLIALFK